MGSFYEELHTDIEIMAKIKADFKRQGNGGFIGRFWRELALVYDRRNTITVDLRDPMSTDGISDVLGCDGSLSFHLTDQKFEKRYMIYSRKLVFGENTKRNCTDKENDAGEYGYSISP